VSTTKIKTKQREKKTWPEAEEAEEDEEEEEEEE